MFGLLHLVLVPDLCRPVLSIRTGGLLLFLVISMHTYVNAVNSTLVVCGAHWLCTVMCFGDVQMHLSEQAGGRTG